MKRIILISYLTIFVLLLSSCKRNIGFKYVEGKVNIVATTTMIGDLAKNIGGDDVSVTTLMNIGVDPHSYVPRPSVTKAISEADLVIINGLNLEAKMGKVLQMIKEDKLLVIGDYVDEAHLLKDENGQVDPHVWFDISNWMAASVYLKNKLIELDGKNSASYISRYNSYYLELIDLEDYVINKVEELDINKRVLVTAHDAFSYFGNAYGIGVYSIQGISTESEASVKDIQDLANLIVDLKVKAIFIESSIPENTIKSVINAAKAKGHNVVIGGTLYGDSLGELNSEANNYINMVKSNIEKIVEGLK